MRLQKDGDNGHSRLDDAELQGSLLAKPTKRSFETLSTQNKNLSEKNKFQEMYLNLYMFCTLQ